MYISNEARKYYDKNKDNLPFKTQNESKNKVNILIPTYEGKVYDPTTNKTINNLRKNENQIIKELSRLNYNEKLLKSDSYLNQYNNNPNNLSNDQKIIDEKIKLIERSKTNYMMKLEELKNRINILQYKQKKELGIIDNNKKTKLNKFIEDFHNKENTHLIEKKIKKLQEESEKLQLLMKKDLEEKKKKKDDEINNREKKEEEKRNDLLKKIRDEEREFVIKRKKKNTEELLKFKEFIKKKPIIENYLYQKQKSYYDDKENNLVKLENIKRKAVMKHIDLKEFDEMRKNFEQIKSKKTKESNEKMKVIKESWSQRYKLIPLYVNSLSKIVSDEENKMKQEEQNKILRRKKLKKLQEKYNVPKPLKIIKEKIKENENKIIKRSKPNLIKSNSYSDILRQKMIDKYKASQNKEKNKKENDDLLEDEDYFLEEQELSQKIISNKKNNDKKYSKTNKSFDKDKNKNDKKKTEDYLKERRKINELNREKKRNAGELTHLDYSGTNDIRKLIKDNGINENMLKVAKCKLESLEEKKRQKNLLLKCSGGVANKPELGEEVCDLMIDSIQAKLSLIKEIDKSLDESVHEERKDENDKLNKYNNIQKNKEENNYDEDY